MTTRNKHYTSPDDKAAIFLFAVLVMGLLASLAVAVSLCYYLITNAN